MLSRGIQRFGEDQCLEHLAAVRSWHDDVPMVSVGSGPGELERRAGDVVCVDPAPPDGCRVDAPTVPDLIRDRPELVGNCTALLCWCLPNGSTYDMEAVELLRPRAVLSLLERFGDGYGAAGGQLFHERMVDRPRAEGYRIVHRTLVAGDGVGAFQWIWWERADAPEPEHALASVVHGHKASGGFEDMDQLLTQCPQQ